VRRVHLDLDVGRRGGEVEARQRAVLVEDPRDRVRVRHDPGHVGRRGERADLQRAIRVPLQLLAQLGLVDVALAVLADRDDVGDRLAPRQLVAVVLERADEHDGPLAGRDVRAEGPSVVEVGRDAQVEHLDQPVDRSRGPGPAEDHGVGLAVPAHAIEHDPAGALPEARGLEPRAGRLRVGVRVQRQDLFPDVVLQEREAAARRRVVGIGHAADPVGARDGLVLADDRRADPLDQLAGGGGCGSCLHGARVYAVRHPAGLKGCAGYNRRVSRFYAPDDADALVPELAPVVMRLRDERAELVELRDAFRSREGDLVEDLIAEEPVPDGDDPELRVIRLRMRGIVDQMQADVAWLDDRGIVLRDIATGLLDFPALVSGRQVWLCWRLGEDHVDWWHSTEEGFAARKPLAALFDDAARA
jgi:hypothetical protein